ncbi:putative Tyrosine-protein phosphatase non-receptor type 1 [Hypsibius exemplaris]|uniref:protein-tyrosine-phosphatase n=1 Tax=Hypsibius exemplaris TaxID=2072580 RepID=A0A1W0W8A2_HYPEX|nr:putative Tyrosine-protein phosphatase non-receptor type 1 [Hypsibius exemplaris]
MSSSVEEQYRDIEGRSGWRRLFSQLDQRGAEKETNADDEEHHGTGISPRKRKRKAFPSDHINADFVRVPDAGRSYICSQGPSSNSVGYFWEMIWAHHCRVIVKLNGLEEWEMAQYWPHNVGASLTADEYDRCHQLTIRLVSQTTNEAFSVRRLSVTRRTKSCATESTTAPSEEQRTVTQFHFLDWPDCVIHELPGEFLGFI